MKHIKTAVTALLVAAGAIATAQTFTREGATSAVGDIGAEAEPGSASTGGGATATIAESAVIATAAFDYTIRVPVDLDNIQRQTTRFRVDCDLFTAEDAQLVPAGRGSRLTTLDPTVGEYSGLVTVGINRETVRDDQGPVSSVQCRLRLCGDEECAAPATSGLRFNSYDPERPSRLTVTRDLNLP